MRLPDGHDTDALLRDAVDHGVAYVPGAPFFAGPADPATLRLSFATREPKEIGRGMERLADVFRPDHRTADRS